MRAEQRGQAEARRRRGVAGADARREARQRHGRDKAEARKRQDRGKTWLDTAISVHGHRQETNENPYQN